MSGCLLQYGESYVSLEVVVLLRVEVFVQREVGFRCSGCSSFSFALTSLSEAEARGGDLSFLALVGFDYVVELLHIQVGRVFRDKERVVLAVFFCAFCEEASSVGEG